MIETPEPVHGRSAPLLDFRSGGWALLLAGVLAAGVVGWQLTGLFSSRTPLMVIGDGSDPATYGFDLSICLIPREQIVAAGFPKDGLPALTEPALMTVAEADEYTAELKRAHSGKFLVAGDRVIGVLIHGDARAYPLNVLNWHEVVNDTVGGVPILVTYNPLCDAAVVFDREVLGQTLEFGVSGLLYNSNLLLYDRALDRPAHPQELQSTEDSISTASRPAGESLWSQLQFRAIAGPAAERGARLTVRPSELVHWSSWKSRFPDTTVLAPDKRKRKLYKRTYESYFGDDRLHFPIWPAPPSGAADELPLKTRVLAILDGERWRVFRVASFDPAVRGGADARLTVAGGSFRAVYESPPETVRLIPENGVPLPPVVHTFWFGWYAMHPAPQLESLP